MRGKILSKGEYSSQNKDIFTFELIENALSRPEPAPTAPPRLAVFSRKGFIATFISISTERKKDYIYSQ